MYLDAVVVDMLARDGTMNNFNIKPKSETERVTLDRRREIHSDVPSYKFDLGGNHIYNFDKCTMEHSKTCLRLEVHDNEYSFKFEHMGIPIGPSKEGRGGIYNLILEPGLRFTDFHIIDPFDNTHEDIRKKKEFKYEVIWDKKYEVQLVEMYLRSRHGSFSFISYGSFVSIGAPGMYNFVKSSEYDKGVISLTDRYYLLKENERKMLLDCIIEKIGQYAKIEPTIIPGVSVKINKMLEDYQGKRFEKKIKREK
ncbi:hypothetical protein MSBRW_1210 [Methanosarcina barkeri str. Wiesmoor]|uniref:Uncharacterized protein n=2 Tax=Methanosarcina barkeri TaxID=2208 RepID=A0A0E3QK50_METBA|nr:hypothetical protein [Methanosarcina barkeri]AKB50463.1 hypothetical protein MSBRW_1210 [Methanosarcina barkeri str. Wiesmoor]